MEHIIQFGITIDDDAIRRQVERSAKEEVIKSLKNDIKQKLISGWGNLTDLSEHVIKEVMEEHKDEIIDKASVLVADSMKRSKKYREALAKIVENEE